MANPATFFSATMPEADEKFVVACRARGVEPEFIVHPQKDPQGHPLHTGIGYWGPKDASNVVVLISATHGIEGYAGAGVQTGVLHTLSESELPESTALLMVHMINPWGCAWDHRENEENIDIWRNILYCDPPFRANPEYAVINDALNPPLWEGPVRDAAEKRLREYEASHGAGSVVGVARRGQHEFPKGVTYHGHGPSWSKHTMDRIVATYLGAAQRIVTYDLHTGYGEYGTGVAVSFEPGRTEVDTRLERCFGPELFRVGGDPILPSHPGCAYDYIRRLRPGADVISFAVEYGTTDVTANFDLMRQANWLFNYGDPNSPSGQAIRREYRAMFYPEHDDWKERVWVFGRDVLLKALNGLLPRKQS
jgi:octopine/nopaline transport system ATP-binding protein